MSGVATTLPPTLGTLAATGLPGRPHNLKLWGRGDVLEVSRPTCKPCGQLATEGRSGAGLRLVRRRSTSQTVQKWPRTFADAWQAERQGAARGNRPGQLPGLGRRTARRPWGSKVVQFIRDHGRPRLTLVHDRAPQPIALVGRPDLLGG